MQLSSQDLAIVDQALRRHPQSSELRISADGAQIEVLLRRPPNVNDMLATYGISDPDSPPPSGRAPGFVLALRFVLLQDAPRLFQAERWSETGWEPLGAPAPLRQSVRPALAAIV
jgi:hypothetical protein